MPGNALKEPAGQTALSQHVLFAAGIPGQRVSRAPGPARPAGVREIPGRGRARRFACSPRGKRRPKGLRGRPSRPRSVCRRRTGAGSGPGGRRGVASLGPFIAPGRSVGAAASRASPAPSRCWRWARGSRRRGRTALVPPPGRDGPRCWRGSPGWTGRCSDRRRTLGRGRAEAGQRVTAGRRAASPQRLGQRGGPGPRLYPQAAPLESRLP